MPAFTDAQIDDALQGLPGWTQEGEAIVKTFEFEDFNAAIAFMNRAAGPIDEMDHHPEWTNVQSGQVSIVFIKLTSHDSGGVTDRDVMLARVLDRLA